MLRLSNSGASARESCQRSTMGKENWHPSSRENLVIMSAYERASEGANAVRTDCGGGGEEPRGNANWGTEECHLFLAGFVKENSFLFAMLTNDNGG